MSFERGRPSEHVDGCYDDFAVCPPGTFGRPDIDPNQRQPREGWLERGREALSFGSDTRFRGLVALFQRLCT
jgi:hypothetical protein